MKLWPDALSFAAGGQKTSPADLKEKSLVRGKNDLHAAFDIEFKAEGELDISDYREMMTDTQAKASVMFKILARLSSGWDISPASDDPADVEVAKFIEDNFNRMNGTMTGFLRRSMLSMAYGLTVHEMTLEIAEKGDWAGKVILKEFKWKRPENFKCKTDDFGNLENLQQKDGNDWIDLDPLYFVIWAYDHEGDFKGKSDLRPAYRWTKGKELLDVIWNVYLEKYATPTPIGKFPPGTDEAGKDEVLNFLTNLHLKGAAVVPQKWEVDLLESTRTGGDYEAKMKYNDRMIARTMLLPTLIVDEGDSGAYALGQQHADNFTWVLDALGEELAEEIILEQVIRPLVDWNFEVEDYPRFSWRPFGAVDLDNMTAALERMINADVIDPGEEWIRDSLGFPASGIDPSAEPEAGPGEDPPGDGEPAKPDADPEDGDQVKFRSPAARKNDAKVIKARNVALEEKAISEIVMATEAMFAKLKLTVKKKRIVEDRDLQAVKKLKLPGIGSIRNTLEQAYGHMIHHGAADALSEVRAGLAVSGRTLQPLPDTMGINLKSWQQDEWDPPEEVKLSSAEIIAHFEGKVPIQKALLSEYAREAFTMANAYQDDLLAGAQRIISKGIRRGASYSQIEGELAAFFRPYMEVEGAMDAALASAYRIETIVRTNMAEAYNSGRMNLFKHPDVGNMIVAYEYSAVMDDRTTPFCADWDGEILLASDPQIDQNNPPNHFRCRSVWIPITKGERFTPTDVPPAATPAQGFMY